MIPEFVAERCLLFSRKSGDDERRKLIVKVSLPTAVDPNSVDFLVDENASMCSVVFSGIDEVNHEVYGADSLQALTLAVDIDPILKSLSGKYDFFWPTGEAYFE